jgi:hypothetical protein
VQEVVTFVHSHDQTAEALIEDLIDLAEFGEVDDEGNPGNSEKG